MGEASGKAIPLVVVGGAKAGNGLESRDILIVRRVRIVQLYVKQSQSKLHKLIQEILMFSAEFLLTSLVVVLIPGTGVIYTVSTGLFLGRRASIAAAFEALGVKLAMTDL